jgi:hypothetical protein
MSDKVGRNDPCSCGSGKKYKRCHGSSIADERSMHAHAFSGEIQFVEDVYWPELGGWHDFYIRKTEMGNVAFTVPSLRSNMHPELLKALKARRQANFKGVCECGAVGSVDYGSGDSERRHSLFQHEDGCIADNDSIGEIIGRVGLDEGGRRLEDEEVF